MQPNLMRIGLIVIVIALLLGNLAVCVESTNDPKKCRGDKPDECNGGCVNLKNDEQNCGICGNTCNQGEVCHNGKCVSAGNNEKGTSGNKKATCTDSKKDGKETDIDCGGPTCPACADGKACQIGTDCSSGVCTGGICQAPSCTDGVKNGGETGIDCGGPCPLCKLKPISGIGNITVLPVQNAPGTPAPNPPLTTPTYQFVLENCVCIGTRSPNTDDDYAGFGVSVNNQVVAAKAKYVGNLVGANDGFFATTPINLLIGPVPIPNDPNVPVVIGYLIVNRGPVTIEENRDALDGTIAYATKYFINSYSGSGSPLAFVDKYLGYLYNSRCDGAVAAAQITTNGNELTQIAPGSSYSKSDSYKGTDSPIGCGSNSQYRVNWHVKRLS